MRQDDPETIVDAAYAAWRLQDEEAWLAYCAESVVYTLHVPTDLFPFGGSSVGKEAARRRLCMIWDLWEFLEMAPGQLTVDGCVVRALVTFRCRHRSTGRLLEGRKRNVWRVENGLVTRYETFHDLERVRAFMRLATTEQA